MKNKRMKKKLKKMIASGFSDLSTDELKALIQNEFDKGADKLDTDYLDLCFELISVKKNETKTKRIKFAKPAKALIATAVIMLISVSTITVFAQFNLNIPQKIAQLINGDVTIDYNLDNADTTADGYALLDTDLAKKLADYGITPVTFPEEMIKENCKITQIDNVSSDEISNIVSINFDYYDQLSSLVVRQMSDNFETAGESTVMNIESGKMIKINGMDVLIFEQENSCVIKYKDSFTNYEISLDCDFKTAVEFAESIK